MVEELATARTDVAVKAATVFQDTADLLARGAGYRFDLDQGREGWRIYYAVDADVLVTYVQPSRNLKHGYLFCADDELAELVVRMTGEFIVRNLSSGRTPSGTGHLLVVSPHDEELHRYLLGLQDELREFGTGKQEDAATVLKWLQSHDSNKEVADLLMDHAAQFVRAVGGIDGPLRALRRFADLNPARLVNLLRYEERSADGTKFSFPKPPRDARDPHFASFSELFEQWKKALVTLKTSKPGAALRNDAIVLASVEWINRQIEQQRARIVLVTGSQSIFDAAAALHPNGGPASNATFEARFLRHPQAFFCDRDFFAVPAEPEDAAAKQFRVMEWLNAFLPKYVGGEGWPKLRSGDISADLAPELWANTLQAGGAADRRDSDIQALVKQWAEQVRNVAVKRGIEVALDDPKSAGAELLNQLQAGTEGWTVADLRKRLTTLARDSLISLYRSSAFLGVLAIGRERNRIRGVPALRIDELYPQAQAICSNMQALMFHGTGMLDLQALYKDLSTVDRDGYHALLIHGFAYTIRGHWIAARTFCRMAIDVADTLEDSERRKRSGREAAYLLAVAERRIATSLEELDSASRYLDEARRREDPGAAEDPRFRSEALAGVVALLLLQQLNPAIHPAGISLSAMETLAAELPGAEDILRGLANERLPEVTAWVTRQVFSNIATLALLSELHRRGSAHKFEGPLSSVLDHFRKRRLAPDNPTTIYRDPLSDFLYWALIFVLGRPERTRGAVKEVRDTDPRDFGRDGPRIDLIRRMCLARVAQ